MMEYALWRTSKNGVVASTDYQTVNGWEGWVNISNGKPETFSDINEAHSLQNGCDLNGNRYGYYYQVKEYPS